MTKKALDEIETGVITTIVDNEVAMKNVSKLAKSSNCEYDTEKVSEDEFRIYITKGDAKEIEDNDDNNKLKDMTIVFGSDKLGKGSDELGKILMKGYIYTLTEAEPYPSKLLFLNSGVKLTTEGSEVIDDLKKLENSGVEILSCGTCLDFYNIKDKLKVGEVTNMYTIVENMKNAENTIVL
ncbi:SirA family protein [Thermohalobacter berrensis]|uniref:SirA family protein n=2 Tax=Thermohalobacter berrensis TaxID=99594 RepID=A0A419T3R5_9FIRM|nr:SirA family protein [Thermohalobacter berrensis]